MNQGCTYRETVAPARAGLSVLEHLVDRWRHGGAQAWSERIARGEVLLGGRPARGDERLLAGQQLQWRRPPWSEPPVPLGFALLHLDPHLLAAAKPAGLPTMPSGGRFLEHTLLHCVRSRFPEVAPLHRLDRGTSGLVLFSRSPLARRRLGIAWQRGQVRRVYRGLVEGSPREDLFEVSAPVGELPHPELGRVFAAAQRGRAARTRVRVLQRRGAETLVEIEPLSGRPHQIRIHLAFAGHPLAGEPFFAAGGLPRPESGRRPGDPGYLLHAELVSLLHPESAARLELWCAPPPPLRA
jgi:23S rRNA pseudouridine1911/1915/1917 synthase